MIDDFTQQFLPSTIGGLAIGAIYALVALGCALAAIGSSPPVAQFARELPHVALAGLLVIFVAWVPLVASPSRRADWS